MKKQKNDDQVRFDLPSGLKARFKLALAKMAVKNKNAKLNQTTFLTAVITDFCDREGV